MQRRTPTQQTPPTSHKQNPACVTKLKSDSTTETAKRKEIQTNAELPFQYLFHPIFHFLSFVGLRAACANPS
jgi:hypothetical protein